MTNEPEPPSTNRADLEKDPAQVSGMFDRVAPRYDLMNDVLTVGNDRLWRAATTRAIGPVRGQRILDLAAGTGTSSAALARSGADVVAADFSPGMLAEGRRRHGHIPNIEFVEADAMDLPFADDEFDAVTISYGLRNVADPRAAIAEMLRVAKPGGRIVICEFSHPPSRLVAAFSAFYNARVIPRVARVLGSNPEAYDYLNESIADWPDQRTLAGWMSGTGWADVAYRDLSFGMVALHRARKPLR